MKQQIRILTFVFLIIGSTLNRTSNNFNQKWQEMQGIYQQLSTACNQHAISKDMFHTSYWNYSMKIIRVMLLGKLNENILYTDTIANAMVRSNHGERQEFEKMHLDCCTSPTVKEKLACFKDNNYEPIWIPGDRIKEYNCSVSSLGHLYYIARALEKNNNPEVIVEFGGGYGNLVRIMKMMLPETTIISIDVPELLTLQKLFLSLMIPDVEVIVHYEHTQNFKKGAIHLLPVYFVEQSTINTDLFISNFALTESPDYVQELIINENFFNASTCYITGQLNGWKNAGFNWISNHSFLTEKTRSLFEHIDFLPYHTFQPNLSSFELIAHIQKK